jgi:hypothetical protein
MNSVARRDTLFEVLDVQIDRLGGDVQALGNLPDREALVEESGYLLAGGQESIGRIWHATTIRPRLALVTPFSTGYIWQMKWEKCARGRTGGD